MLPVLRSVPFTVHNIVHSTRDTFPMLRPPLANSRIPSCGPRRRHHKRLCSFHESCHGKCRCEQPPQFRFVGWTDLVSLAAVERASDVSTCLLLALVHLVVNLVLLALLHLFLPDTSDVTLASSSATAHDKYGWSLISPIASFSSALHTIPVDIVVLLLLLDGVVLCSKIIKAFTTCSTSIDSFKSYSRYPFAPECLRRYLRRLVVTMKILTTMSWMICSSPTNSTL